jgi:hypothetical protein
MSSSRVTTFIIGALVLLAATWWFTTFERVTGEQWVGLPKTTREDPYLLLKRLLEKSGGKLVEADKDLVGEKRYAELPAGGTVILGTRRDISMSPAMVKRILDWVDAGGHLVLETEVKDAQDPLLVASGLTRADPKWEDFKKSKSGDRSRAELPGLGKFQLDLSFPRQVISDPYERAQWQVSDELGIHAAHLTRGQGLITVVTSLNFMKFRGNGDSQWVPPAERNDSIRPPNLSKYDNAAFALAVLKQNPRFATTQIKLITGNDARSLLRWLIEHAWAVISALIALIVLILWRAIPRFGPLVGDPAPAELRLGAHLKASGLFFWRHQTPPEVFARLRTAFDTRVAERRPALIHASLERRAQTLAPLANLNPDKVAQTLSTPVHDAQGLLRAVSLVQRLWNKL